MLTPQQIEKRRGRIGSSSIGSLVGVGRKTPYQIWEEMTGCTTGGNGNRAMERGNVFERPACELLCIEHDRFIHAEGFTVTGEECGQPDWFVDTVDFLVRPVKGGPVEAVEIKCVGSHNRHLWGESGTQNIPPAVRCQVAWHMIAHNVELCWVVAFFAFDDVRFYRVERDRELEAGLLRAAAEFYDAYILPGVPPPLNARDDTGAFYRHLSYRHPDRDGELVITPEEHEELYGVFDELRSLREQARRIETREKELTRRAVEAAGSHRAIVGGFGSFRYVTQAKPRWERIARLAGATPELIAENTQTVGFFRPHFKGENEQ